MKPLLCVENLYVCYGDLYALKGVNFQLFPGEILGVVGVSGSGKSTLGRALMGLLPSCHVEGKIIYQGMELNTLCEKQMRCIRGKEIGMIFQDPMTSLNPTSTVGSQILEGRGGGWNSVLHMLESVGFADPKRCAKAYPHTLSGGMCQRAMIALSLFSNPKILIADEPTTSLDAVTQFKILNVLKDLQKRLHTSIVLITHDFNVVTNMCDRVLVLDKGIVVESASTSFLLSNPSHPITQKLLQVISKRHELKKSRDGSTPKTTQKLVFSERESSRDGVPLNGPICISDAPLIRVEGLKKHFKVGKGLLKAVDGVTFSIRPGETCGLVGESGCGKSTLGKMLLGLEDPSSGDIFFEEKNIGSLSRKEFKSVRLDMQGIFQNPYAALNPRMTVGQIISEPFDVHGCFDGVKITKVKELMDMVELPVQAIGRFPREFSGGQRQRIAIARALALKPKFLVCDEVLSSLDVSAQESIVSLLDRLQQTLGITYLFISHDLAMVKRIADSVAIMCEGRIVEWGCTEEVYHSPGHPYTQSLLERMT